MRCVAEGGQIRVAQQSRTENRKGKTNLTDKTGLAMESVLMAVEVGEEGPMKRAETCIEGGPGRAVGGVGLAVVGLVLRYD